MDTTFLLIVLVVVLLLGGGGFFYRRRVWVGSAGVDPSPTFEHSRDPFASRSRHAGAIAHARWGNNTLTAMTISIARANRLPVDEGIARKHVSTIASLLEGVRENVLVTNRFVTNTASNILVGLAAERYRPDATTDALVHYLKARQLPDGRWLNFYDDHRPPIQGSDIAVTATSIRALRVYAPVPLRADYEQAVRRAAVWLMNVRPRTTDEQALRLLGLKWAGLRAAKETISRAASALIN